MAFPPKLILVATDFRSGAQAAEADALLLGRTFGAEIKLVHVQPFAWEKSARLTALGRDALRACTERLGTAGARVRAPELLHGSAAEACLNSAEASSVDLIVVGAPGQREVPSASAETVARFAREPVWIARPRTERGIHKLLCGVDGSPASERAARDASLLARALSAKLLFVHAVDYGVVVTAPALEAEQRAILEDLRRKTIEYIDRHLTDFAPRAERRHLIGRPDEVIRRVASEESFDLVVMGRVGAGGLRRVLLGGTAERLLRTLPCGLWLTNPTATTETAS